MTLLFTMHLVQQRMSLLVFVASIAMIFILSLCTRILRLRHISFVVACQLNLLLNLFPTLSVLRACKSARYFHSGEITSSIAFKLFSNRKFILMVIIT